MGLNAGLYVIPAAKFATAQAKGTWSRHAWHKCTPYFDLDKAWFEINEVLESKPAPLCFAIEGNVRPNAEELDFAFVSPEVVAEIAGALDSLDPNEIVDAIEEESGGSWKDRQGERGYYTTFFEKLRNAYRTASDSGAAVGILVC